MYTVEVASNFVTVYVESFIARVIREGGGEGTARRVRAGYRAR